MGHALRRCVPVHGTRRQARCDVCEARLIELTGSRQHARGRCGLIGGAMRRRNATL